MGRHAKLKWDETTKRAKKPYQFKGKEKREADDAMNAYFARKNLKHYFNGNPLNDRPV